MNADLFLDDFEAEARTHIERIETAFLDVDALTADPKLMDGVFRTAHSLKGTASFFSLDKIVAVSHELESVFSQIKDGRLAVTEEIADAALQSVDCLKELVDNLRSDDRVDTGTLLRTLRRYSGGVKAAEKTAEPEPPFVMSDPDTEKALRKAARFGHKIYSVSIGYNRSLGIYYKHPESMIDNILSIGTVAEAVVDGTPVRDGDPAALTAKLLRELTARDTAALELLVTSVLEPDLFSIAVEIDKKYIRLIPKERILGDSKKTPKQAETGPDGARKTVGDTEAEKLYKPAPARDSGFSIRLDISAINGLMDLANEMILVRNQMLSAVSGYRKSIAGLTPVLHDMNRLTSEIQEKVMLTRMQPISVIFGKFPRIIRDTAKALNKEIRIEIYGDDVTLDKYLLDALTDPITQLVKNAADHGLEPAARRAELGKPPKGKITLYAHMREGSAIIEVSDDGAGIDLEALKRKSAERGIASEEQLAGMSRAELFGLIFEPGISTAQRVTNLSGRGVGMDIVKTNIEKLGGSIEIDSETDKGTTVRLKLPLTLSVIRTLIVTVDGISYAVPESNIERIVRIWRASPSKRLERINKSLALSLGGRIIPVVTMEEIAARARGGEPPDPEALLERTRKQEVVKCLVLRAGDKSFALLIDDAIETEQTLVKPLPVYLQSCLCYSSVTVLGNGSAITILDAEGIIRLMGIEAPEQPAAETAGGKPDEEGPEDRRQVILFNCSGSEYFALETNEIARIEAISAADIQEIGTARYINIAGETVQVIRPENYAPVKKRQYSGDKLYLLTLKKSAPMTGLLVGRVIDKIENAFRLDTDQLSSAYIHGTSVFNEKILIFLDAEAINADIETKRQKRKL
ncbi:MAG: chemotaxis protein CheA [Oscillospiraceae bacterium]|nr:chemotaxis protein CheA [Oscillospiraceae bacterium]